MPILFLLLVAVTRLPRLPSPAGGAFWPEMQPTVRRGEMKKRLFMALAVTLLLPPGPGRAGHQDRSQRTPDRRHPQGGRGHQVRRPDVAGGREGRRRPQGRRRHPAGGTGDRGQRVQGRERGPGQYQDDHRGRGAGHRGAPVLQAGGSGRGGGQQLRHPHDLPLVHQPRHHQGPALRLPGLLPGSLPGAGGGQVHHRGVQGQEGRGALRRGQRLPQGPGRVLQGRLGKDARPGQRGGLRELHHQGRRLLLPADQDHQLGRPGDVRPPVL